MIDYFSVFFHVSSQNSLKWTEKSLESASINPNKSAWNYCFNACLSDCVFHKSDLSEILASLIIEDFLNGAVILTFFSDKFSFSDDVKLVSNIALMNNVLIGPKLFFFQSIANLILFIRVHFSQNINRGKNFSVIISLIDCSLLNNVSESMTIKFIQNTLLLANNRRCTRCVVH